MSQRETDKRETEGTRATDPDQHLCLTSNEGRELLDRVSRLVDQRGSLSIANQRRLQSDYPARLVGQALDQLDLRNKATRKFRRAEEMFFSKRSLEQASDEAIARYKSDRFGPGPVADLCCGIGGDLIQLAQARQVVGLDYDRQLCAYAKANLAVYGAAERGQVVCGEAATFDVGQVAAWHMDPDRRAQGGRTTHVEAFSPSWSETLGLLAKNANAALKLAPASEPPPLSEPHVREWIGNARECRQQVIWCGDLAQRVVSSQPDHSIDAGPIHRATLAEFDRPAASIQGRPNTPLEPRRELGRFLYDPHSVILASDLLGELARRLTLFSIAAGAVYLTGDEPLHDPFLQGFEILECAPFDRRRWRQLLRERNIGRLEIKKRGVDIRPEQIRRELKLRGSLAAVLIIVRQDQQVLSLLARRLPIAESAETGSTTGA